MHWLDLFERRGVLPNGQVCRMTPSDQPTVDDLVYPGQLIETHQDYRGVVREVHESTLFEKPVWVIEYVEEGVGRLKSGEFSDREIERLSEVVAVDGEIRSFYAFEDWTLETYGPAQGYQQTFEGFTKAGP